jgi:hypothetical protein
LRTFVLGIAMALAPAFALTFLPPDLDARAIFAPG